MRFDKERYYVRTPIINELELDIKEDRICAVELLLIYSKYPSMFMDYPVPAYRHLI